MKSPTDAELATKLGAAKTLWDHLIARLAESGIAGQEWNSYSRKAGWALRLKVKKRNIVYLSPYSGSFGVSFALGDQAVDAARHSTLPKRVIKLVEEGKRYAEGTAVRMEVTSVKDLDAIITFASIKLRY